MSLCQKLQLTAVALVTLIGGALPSRAQTLNFKHVYIAVASPSSGMARFGYAFLVFTHTPKDFKTGVAYQYENLVDDALKTKGFLSTAKMFKDGTLPMGLSRLSASAQIDQYTRENRLVSLYPLQITSAQVQAIYSRIDGDYVKRQGQSTADYAVKRNCLSQLIDHINAVLGVEQGFETNWKNGEMNSPNYFSRDAWASFIPAYFERTLRHSPRVNQKGVHREMPREVTQLKEHLVVLPFLESIFKKCKWAIEQSTVIRSFMFNDKTRVTKSFNRYFTDKLNACTGIETNERSAALELLNSSPARD